MGNDHTHVRVRTSTLARLKAARDSFVESHALGLRKDPGVTGESINPEAGELSLDRTIAVLLDQLEAHRERARRAKLRRRTARAASRDGQDDRQGGQ